MNKIKRLWGRTKRNTRIKAFEEVRKAIECNENACNVGHSCHRADLSLVDALISYERGDYGW